MKKIMSFAFSIALVMAVAEPTVSNLGARQIINGEEKEQFENPYITDGLIAMWDGQFNGRNGKHDPDGGLIELLSGVATYVRRGSYTIEDDCIVGNSVVIASPPIPAIVNMDGSGELTIEACCMNYNSGRPIMLGTDRPFSDRMFSPNGTYWMIHNSCTDSDLNSKWASGFRNNERRSRTLVVSSGTVQWFIDGVPDASATRTKDFTTSSLPFSVFGWDWDFSFPATGDFCCLRMYNRALSAEEIAYNYAIDKERFNLP